MGNFQKEYGKSEPIDYYLNQAVAEILKELREQRQWSYTDLSAKLKNKVTRQTLNNYELGKTKVRMDIFFDLAKVYLMTPTELYEKVNLRYISKLYEYAKELSQKNKEDI